MTEACFSVGELAELIKPADDADTAAITERLRFWTEAGLIEATSAGSDHRRSYDESAVYWAAVLLALADLPPRSPIVQAPFVTAARFEVARAQAAWIKRDQQLDLEIADFVRPDRAGRPRYNVYLHEGRKSPHAAGTPYHPTADAAIFVNLSRLFWRVDMRLKALVDVKAEGRKIRRVG
jgi:hypothetical protein